MKSKTLTLGIGLLGVAVAGVVGAHDGERGRDRDGRFSVATALRPAEEVPAVSSVAKGFFKATIDVENETISYELSYEGLEATPTQAHIHVGQMSVNGGISVFLCTNLPNPPTPAPQPCPAAPATITGTLTAANLVATASAQGVEPGQFSELANMIRKGLTYANVHTTRFPGGEVRGQIDDISKK
jgi:CHRD domain